MRVVIQRVSSASVEVETEIVGSIEDGFLILLGIEVEDDESDADWLTGKIASMRIFRDEDDKMNRSLKNNQAGVLIVSQFTLHATTKKGNRPSFIKAARPDQAIPLYEYFIKKMRTQVTGKVESGTFGAMMKVALVNDGPVTILMDSKNRE